MLYKIQLKSWSLGRVINAFMLIFLIELEYQITLSFLSKTLNIRYVFFYSKIFIKFIKISCKTGKLIFAFIRQSMQCLTAQA